MDAFTLSRTSPWPGRGTGTVRSSTLQPPGRYAARMLCSMFFIVDNEFWRARSFSNQGGVISPFISQRSSHDWPSFHRNTWPLISRQFRSMAPMASISSSVNGSLTTPSRLLRMWSRSVENGIGYLPALNSPLHADNCRMHAQAIGNCNDHGILGRYSIFRCAIAHGPCR